MRNVQLLNGRFSTSRWLMTFRFYASLQTGVKFVVCCCWNTFWDNHTIKTWCREFTLKSYCSSKSLHLLCFIAFFHWLTLIYNLSVHKTASRLQFIRVIIGTYSCILVVAHTDWWGVALGLNGRCALHVLLNGILYGIFFSSHTHINSLYFSAMWSCGADSKYCIQYDLAFSWASNHVKMFGVVAAHPLLIAYTQTFGSCC